MCNLEYNFIVNLHCYNINNDIKFKMNYTFNKLNYFNCIHIQHSLSILHFSKQNFDYLDTLNSNLNKFLKFNYKFIIK